MISSRLMRAIRPRLDSHPRLKRFLRRADIAASRMHHSIAEFFPSIIRPAPRQLTVAVTAACNQRCIGCRYGRDFMVGEHLPLDLALDLLDDAAAAGINRVRLFGGEPLLHPELPQMIRRSTSLGMDTYITTNGVLLKDRVDELHAAGLRWLTMGFYGAGAQHEAYTQRPGGYERVVAGLEAARARYAAAIELQLNFVVLRPTCNLETLAAAWSLARRFDMFLHVDIHGYSIPFFSDGPGDEVAFRPEDRPVVQAVADELVRLKREYPQRVSDSMTLLRSIPDWVMKGAGMRVPCDAYELIWVGANGVVQLCDVYFPLGNLHERRLRDMLFNKKHRRACRDAFQLRCPNCTCKVNSRVQKHAASVRRYGR